VVRLDEKLVNERLQHLQTFGAPKRFLGPRLADANQGLDVVS
jgi:hypothetical protein